MNIIILFYQLFCNINIIVLFYQLFCSKSCSDSKKLTLKVCKICLEFKTAIVREQQRICLVCMRSWVQSLESQSKLFQAQCCKLTWALRTQERLNQVWAPSCVRILCPSQYHILPGFVSFIILSAFIYPLFDIRLLNKGDWSQDNMAHSVPYLLRIQTHFKIADILLALVTY